MVHAVLSETQTESVDTEVSNLLRKQAIKPVNMRQRNTYPHLHPAKERWNTQNDIEPKVPQQKYHSPSFQDGYSVNCCSTDETWVLYGVN